jgi:hypothetical protein
MGLSSHSQRHRATSEPDRARMRRSYEHMKAEAAKDGLEVEFNDATPSRATSSRKRDEKRRLLIAECREARPSRS